MQSEAQKRAKARYDKKTARQVVLKLNSNTDGDILERLSEVGNKQGYIKNLIRKDIRRG